MSVLAIKLKVTVKGSINENFNYQPCCIPSGFEALEVMYEDHSGAVVFKKMPDMRVTACVCK